MAKTTIGAGRGGVNPNFMQAHGNKMSKFSTVLSSDSVDPDEYCALAYQDSEIDSIHELSARNDAYAGSRLPARMKSPHKKLFLEPQESELDFLEEEDGQVSWRVTESMHGQSM